MRDDSEPTREQERKMWWVLLGFFLGAAGASLFRAEWDVLLVFVVAAALVAFVHPGIPWGIHDEGDR